MTNAAPRLYIGGEWTTVAGGVTEAVLNPATEAVIAQVPVGDRASVDAAIGAARHAFDQGPWPRKSVRERAAVLAKMLDWFDANMQRIVGLIVAEAGATQMLAAFLHYMVPMKHARAALEEAQRIQPQMAIPEVTPSMDGKRVLGTAFTEHEPVGVVSAITPYNFPFFLNLGKVVPALVMGNTVVLKPSPLTPLLALIFGEAADAAGLPKGVLNIVTGDLESSQLLTTDARVDLVTFTGSDVVGARIMAQGAPTLKRMVMELGGKSALIVRADADIMRAAQDGLAQFTIHAGQGCALQTRHLVHNKVRAQYVQAMTAMAAHLKVGDPADASVMMGPLIRPAARERVERYVEAGLASGATLAFGGRRPPALAKGFFFEPTLFDGVDNAAKIAQEEIFGPVGCVIGFDSDDDAIRLANDSVFGLGGGIYSADAGRAFEMARRIRTGSVAINGGPGTMLSDMPFGGTKRSGFGREFARAGLLEFTYSRSITFHAG
jgi:acyl-CoA reductase-like NAD-dependent aldehyde dehydrogenase